MRRAVLLFLPLLLLGARPGLAKDDPPRVEVQKAVDAGAAWLTKRFENGFTSETFHDPVEIVMLTLSHAGADRKGDVFQAGLKMLETCELRYTYRVSVLAMTLSHLNPFRYRDRLAACAQWLVDTQLEGGEWGYPGSIQGPKIESKPIPPEPEGEEAEEQPKVSRLEPLVIERRNDPSKFRGARGDFSNTQFAILGLWACLDARIVVPQETWQAALDYMKRYQQEDGSWGYVYGGEQDQAGYASLTCAGIVGAAICLHGLGKKNVKSQAIVKRGLKWLATRWDAATNVGIDQSAVITPSTWQYYHLYSVERVGRVLNLKKIGRRSWYAEGARWLLANQRPDGSWKDEGGGVGGDKSRYLHTADTCFAILFLTLSTPPLTGGGR